MNDKDDSRLVPLQTTGKTIDVEESIELNDIHSAENFFNELCGRLLNVNSWKHYAGVLSADFQLTDKKGNPLDRAAQKGDLIKIDIPGPGPEAGNGYDWVEIETIQEKSGDEEHSLGMRVRPVSSPLIEESDISHFYSSESTSTFLATRRGRKIMVGVYDRNTKPNTSADSVVDKMRDAAVGAAAIAAFSSVQWTKLAKGLLKE
jgi:hypothetical protein